MNSISDVINDSNFIKVNHLGLNKLYVKLEGLNPAGSIKLKAAVGMINALEEQKRINSNTVLIESSSGNLGVALSMVCAERGYRFTCVVDPNTSASTIKMMKALGADIVMVDKRDENGGFLGTRIAYIHDVLKTDSRYLWINQYANPENPLSHARTTALFIAKMFPHIDYLFVGAGTTGTLMGCVKFFREHRPDTKIIAVDSIGSVTFGHPPSKRYIPGLGTSRRPEIYSPEGIDFFEMVDEAKAVAMCRYLARTNGFVAGGSTGSVLAVIDAWRDRLPVDATIVAISPDQGEKYLDTVYNDEWVAERFGKLPLVGKREFSIAA